MANNASRNGTLTSVKQPGKKAKNRGPKNTLYFLALLILTALGGMVGGQSSPVAAQTPSKTSFTYQGQLLNNGARLTASCSFQFTLYDAATAGNVIGATQTVDNITVKNSYFNTQLDFGLTPFGDTVNYLALAVKCPSDAAFTEMTTRVPLTPAPTALVAQKALALPWSGLSSVPSPLTFLGNPTACTNGQVAKWNSTTSTWACGDITVGTDTLASLACTNGQVVKRNSTNTAWECAADTDTTYTAGAGLGLTGTTFSLNSVDDVPIGATTPSTGKFTTLEAANLNITGGAGDGKVLTSDASGAATWQTIAWSGLSSVPSPLTFLGNPTPCTNGQVAKWDIMNSTWACGDITVGTDTLASLACSNEQVAKWDSMNSTWACGDITVGTDTLTSLACSNGQVAKWNSVNTAWECAADTDTNTTYTAGSGLGLTGTTFSLNAVDGVPIGGTTAAAGKFTTLEATSLKVTGGTPAVGQFLGSDASGNATWQTPAWSNLSSIPANLTSFSGLACTSGQVAKWNGTAWACAADTDTTYTAGTGLTLASSTFGVNFAGNGSAATAARSDHTHAALTAVDGVPIGGTTAATGKFTTLEAASLKVTGGGGGGKVLTSDASGAATWQAPVAPWALTGNAGTTPGTNFIGTTDVQALEFKVNGARALRIEPAATNTDPPNIIGGYSGNNVTSGVKGATIAGGGLESFVNSVAADYGTGGGGEGNNASSIDATVSGGYNNNASNNYATVGGGSENTASGGSATVGGGYKNSAAGWASVVSGGSSNTASGSHATVGGGFSNTASGYIATVSGGNQNTAAGDYSFAAGYRAKANANGTFVWADSTNADFTSSTANEFAVRATGGVRFVTNTAGNTGATLAAGSGTWSNTSDRNAKANFVPVDSQNVLSKVAALPLSTWNYKTQDAKIRHMGPMAQDLYQSFGLGEDDKHISTIDADGVALAAIQGLAQQAQTQQAQLEAQQAEITLLKERLTTLEALLKQK